jgi:hypothetical protein
VRAASVVGVALSGGAGIDFLLGVAIMSDAASRKKTPIQVPLPRKPSRDVEGDGPVLPPLAVRYYRKMRSQHVYSVVVSWTSSRASPPAPGVAAVTVRLLGGGAQIVPSEQVMDPAKPEKTATFYMTPLAIGRLRGVRVEVLYGGRKVQEIPLACKTVQQRTALVLLLLSLIVPWLLLHFFKYNAPVHHEKRALGGAFVELKTNQTPGEVVEMRLNENLPEALDVVKNYASPLEELGKAIPSYVGKFYDLIYNAQVYQKIPLPLYSFLGLLFLSLCSFLLNQERRKRRVGKAVELPATVAAAGRRADPLPTES